MRDMDETVKQSECAGESVALDGDATSGSDTPTIHASDGDVSFWFQELASHGLEDHLAPPVGVECFYAFGRGSEVGA
jgi:hypothetical protein